MWTYRVKITRALKEKKPTFIWGGTGTKINTPANLLLVIRVDEDGEAVDLSTLDNDSSPRVERQVGRLAPGEVFGMNLRDAGSVAATCEFDCYVTCTLIALNSTWVVADGFRGVIQP